jgi:hypothetical protein
MVAVSLQAESRPTIECAVQLFLTDKKSQGLDSTAHKKHERELGRLESFMAKRGKLFPQEISLEDLTEFRAGLNGNPQYIFWNRGEGKPKAAVDVWERAFKRVFKRAGISKGHTSIKTTEKSYSPWVTARQDRLDSLVLGTFQARDKAEAQGRA